LRVMAEMDERIDALLAQIDGELKR